ncbi:MAG: coproporphyrinogen dehydrogenase HemZ [Lachnospiraceae bacterium]
MWDKKNIEVKVNIPSYEYDIHSLVKAFYPKADVSVQVKEQFETDCLLKMDVFFDDGKVKVDVWEGDEAIYLGFADLPDTLTRKEVKDRFKRLIYTALSDYSGRSLPWGTLTGIRPTKIPMAMLETGASDEEIRNYMKETYYCSDEKIRLSTEIARWERKLLGLLDYKDGYSLYIGIPFCPSTCLYCSFTSYPLGKWEKRVDDYLDALLKELEFIAGEYAGKVLNTVYIGGGTPTTLSAEQMDRLLTAVEERFDLSEVQEFTVEAGRPDSVDEEKLYAIKKHAVTRISVNPQTMKDETLRVIGRHHTVQQTIDAFKMARKAGFDNINMDLIIGLPGETREDVAHTLEELGKLDPDSITVHSLAIKRAARLNLFKDTYEEMGLENSAEIMDLTYSACKDSGLLPYYLYRQKNMAGNFENVGYAKTDKAGIYNILIMEEKQSIIAAGAGASTKMVYPDGRIERVENVKDVGQYIDRIDEMIQRKKEFWEKNGR